MRLLIPLITLLTLSGVAGPLSMEPDETPSIVAVTADGPEMTSQVSPRFGQTNYFTIVDLKSDHAKKVVRVSSTQSTGVGRGLANELIKLRAGVVITGKIGPKAHDVLRTAEVKVIQGVSGTVEDALRRFESGELR